MMKCPTCKRINDDIAISTCKRCGTDLFILYELDKLKAKLIKLGCARLKNRQIEGTKDYFSKVLEISKNSADACRGMVLTNLLQGNYKDSLHWYFKSQKS